MIDFVGLDLIEFRGLMLADMNLRFQPTSRLVLTFHSGKVTGKKAGETTTVVFKDLIHLSTGSIDLLPKEGWVVKAFDYSVTNSEFTGKLSCLEPEGQTGIEIDLACRQVMMEDVDDATPEGA